MITLDSASLTDEDFFALPSTPARRSRTSSCDTADSVSFITSAPQSDAEQDIMRPLEPVEDTDVEEERSNDLEIGNDGDYEEGETTEAIDEQEIEEIVNRNKPGFVRTLLDSAIDMDLRDSTFGIVKGDYHVEKKTLLHHATTSDQYDLFSQRRPFKRKSESS